MRGERLPISQLVVLMAGLMIFFSVAVDEPNSPASEPEQSFEYGYPWIKGLKYEVSGPNGIVTRVKADSLSLVARRIFLFNIKSLNEIQLENAEIEAHFFEEPSEKLDLLPFHDDSNLFGSGGILAAESGKPYGTITRSVIYRGVSVKIFNSDALVLTLTADSASVKNKKSYPEFFRARLESAESGKRIISDKIIWDVKARWFVIPGPYLAQTPKGRASGTDITVDLDFNVSPL